MSTQVAFDFAGDVDRLLQEAGAAVESVRGLVEIDKSIWGSPAGKTHLAKRLAELIPPHRTYVEPFAGGAQVLLAKEPSEIEVVSDLDPEIAFAFRFARDVTGEQLDRLRKMLWTGDKVHFRKLYESPVPEDPVERFYRFAYLSRFSFNKLRRGTMPDKNVGASSRFVERLEKFAPRIRKIRVRSADYEKVIKEFDGPDTFFFLDPPYAGYDADCRVGAGHKNWDEARFGEVLRRIKGKFIVTYGTRGAPDLFKGLHVERWRHTSGVGTSQGHGLKPGVTLVATNFDPKRTKAVAKSGPPEAEIEKGLFRSPAGKRNVLGRLLPLIPEHKRYVEPFAGGAAVFFAKEPAAEEVINDRDPTIAFAYRFIQKLTPERLARLKRFNWTNGRDTFNAIKAKRPKNDLERFHQFIYLNRWGYFGKGGEHATFNPAHDGETFTNFDKFEKGKERLQGVTILNDDYAKVVRRFDGPDTFFFFDPPFPGYDQAVGESEFDEPRFAEVLRGIQGKFLVTYGIRSDESVFKGFKTRRIIVPTATPKGAVKRALLLISNYEIKKSLGPDVDDVELVVPVSAATGEDIADARPLAAELAEVAPGFVERTLRFVRDVSPAARKLLEDLPALARQLRDVLGEVPNARAQKASRGALTVARDLRSILPGVREALAGDALTGPRRVVERMTEALDALEKIEDQLATAEDTGTLKQEVPTDKLAIDEIDPHSLRSLPDQELLSLNRRTHQLFGRWFEGSDRTSAGGLTREDLINAQLFLLDEMRRRAFEVDEATALNREAADFRAAAQKSESDLAPVRASGEVQGPALALDEVLPHFKTFQIRQPFLFLVGGLANNGRTENDIDLLVRGPLDERTRRVIEFRLGRMLPPELASRIHLVDDDVGPFTSHIPLADLVVEMRGTFERKEMRALVKQDDPLMDVPPKPGKREAVLQYHFRGKSLHLDLRLQVDDWLAGWTLSNQKPGAIRSPVDTIAKARALARSFSVEGDRISKSLVAPSKMLATPKARQPLVWLEVNRLVADEGEVGATRNEKGVFYALDHPKVEFGLQKPFFHEYFFTKGRHLSGILLFRLLVGEGGDPAEQDAGRKTPNGEPFWTAFLSKSLLPSVLKPRAVETKSMPPDGTSAIPVSLEEVTPEAFRYWEESGEAARKTRDALVKERFFTEDNIKLVDGELRRVVQKLYLTPVARDEVEKALRVPFQSWGGSAHYAKRLALRLPEHDRYVEPFCGSAAVFFAKERAAEEILADIDPEVVFALKYIRDLTPASFAALKRFDWTVSRAGFDKARELDPASDAARFWRFVYGRLATWGAKPTMSGYSTLHDGQSYPLDELWKFHERLDGVQIQRLDWRETLRRFDGKGTLFFVDPPYEEEWAVGDGIPATDIADGLDGVAGDWVVAYTASAPARRALGKAGHLFTLSSNEARHDGAFARRPRLFASRQPLRRAVGKQAEVDFTLSWQFFKGQTVIRPGPSREVWHLFLDRPGGGLDSWELAVDPLSGEDRVTAVYRARKGKKLLEADQPVAPGEAIDGNVLNTTKATPSELRIQDRGRVEIIDDEKGFKKLHFRGDKLKGVYTLTQEEAGSDIWIFSEGKEPSRRKPAAKLDRTDLRPLQTFTPMKPRVGKEAGQFFDVDAVIKNFATPALLSAGISVEAKFNGLRTIMEKRGDEVLIFFEDTKDDRSRILPGLARAVRALPKDAILDGELLDFLPDGSPQPRRTLSRFTGPVKPQDDANVVVQVFDVLYWGDQNLTAHPWTERQKVLARLFKKAMPHMRHVEPTIVRDEKALREAIDKATKVPGSEGAMLKLIDSTYSLGGFTSSWAKYKRTRVVHAIVVERHQVEGSPDVFNFYGAVGPIPRGEADRWKETVEVGGHLYTPIGKTFNAKLDAKVGDIIEVQFTELLVDKSGDKQSVTWFTPVVLDVSPDRKAPDDIETVVALAQPEEIKKVYARYADLAQPIVKRGSDEERFTLGIVLEPDVVDAQGDRYTVAEVRKACHRFAEFYWNAGLMHREIANGRIVILENYLAPSDFSVVDPAGKKVTVKAGTWLQGRGYRDDRIWSMVKRGELTGLSMGGSAIRKPATKESNPNAQSE